MINFTAQTIQVYKADIRDHEAKLRRMDATEKKSERVAVQSSEKKAAGGKKLAQQMDILTMAVGGMGSEVGKGAEIGKRLADGFGLMGVAMFGLGFALREIAPLITGAIGAFSDLLTYGTTEKWTPIQDRVDELNASFEYGRSIVEAYNAELALLTTGQRAGVTVGVKKENVAKTAEDATAARAKLAFTTDLLASAEHELAVAEKQLAYAVNETEAFYKWRDKRDAMVEYTTAVRKEWRMTSFEVMISAEKQKTAIAELELAQRNLAKTSPFEGWFKDPSPADWGDDRNILVRTADGLEVMARGLNKIQPKKIKQAAEAIVELTKAEKALLEVMRDEAAIRAAGVSTLGSIAPDKFRAVGARTAGLGEIPGGIAEYNDIMRPGDVDFADAMPKGFGKDVAGELALASDALGTFRDNALEAFSAFVNGSKSMGQALKELAANTLGSIGMKLLGISIEEGVLALVDLAKGNIPGATAHGVVAKTAALGSAATLALAAGLGYGFGGSGAAASVGAGSVGMGGGAVQQTSHTVIYVGDSYTNESNRRKQAAFNRLMKNSGQGSYAS